MYTYLYVFHTFKINKLFLHLLIEIEMENGNGKQIILNYCCCTNIYVTQIILIYCIVPYKCYGLNISDKCV